MQSQYSGLEERCRILNNDELADALSERYDALGSWSSKWRFEVVSLLLQLADAPFEKSNIEELEVIKRPSTPPPLTWQQILRDDPYDDKEIWDSIDYGAATSDEDDTSLVEGIEEQGSIVLESPETSLGELPLIGTTVEAEPDVRALEELLESRRSYEGQLASERPLLTETQLLRETIFMLLGLPTGVYRESISGDFSVGVECVVQDLSHATIDDLLRALCKTGSRVGTIRRWIATEQVVPLLQTLQFSLSKKLQVYHSRLSRIEESVIYSEIPSITLLTFASDVQSISKCLLLLESVLPPDDKDSRHYSVLETLYELVCLMQSLGDADAYTYVAEIFFDCFNTYLKPLRAWMQEGLLEKDDQIFFVKRKSERLPLSSLWTEQFYLLRDADGALSAPKFLHLFARKIFVAGKSINFLDALGQTGPTTVDKTEPSLDFESVYSHDSDSISPFEELLTASLGQWIASKYKVSSSHLLNVYISQCDLWRTLDALDHVFFFRNGALVQQVAYRIFDKIDSGKRWQDRFALTDLFQERLGEIQSVESSRITIRILGDPRTQQPELTSLQKLGLIAISYRLPWTTATVIRPEYCITFRRISTILLQLQRARQLLDRQSLSFDSVQKQNSTTRKSILSLRHRLRWLVETLQTYFVKTVLQPVMVELKLNVSKAEDLDDLLKLYATHVSALEVSCLLATSQQSTLKALVSLLDLVGLFSDLCFSTLDTELRRSTKVTKAFPTSDDDSASEDEAPPSSNKEKVADSLADITGKLAHCATTYHHLLSFVFAGAQETSRNYGVSSLQMLVDNLRLGVEAS